ncbi:MAG: dihydroneopterin aldolase, partial [Ruminococcus sp.]
MYDTIKIKDLEVYANHGVYPEENKLGQKFLITAQLYTDFSDATENDDIEKSIDYGEVSYKITEFLQNNT